MNSGDPRPCEAGFVFALETEADPLGAMVRGTTSLRGALEVHEGLLAGRRIAWVVGGAGMAAAARAADLLVAGHRPHRLVSAGFAGGLDAGIPRGTIVAATHARRAGSPDIALQPLHCPGIRRVGSIVTVDGVVTTTSAKRALAGASDAAVVDMETYAVARVAAAAGLPCLSIRVVSDAADDELPDDIARLVAPQSALRRAGAALAAIGRKPAAAATLWRLWERAVIDGRALAVVIEREAATWPAAGGTMPAAPLTDGRRGASPGPRGEDRP